MADRGACSSHFNGAGGDITYQDVLSVKQAIMAPKAAEGIPVEIFDHESANETARNNIKSNPQSVLNLSNMLEKKWGRKPSFEEVMEYIDGLALPENR